MTDEEWQDITTQAASDIHAFAGDYGDRLYAEAERARSSENRLAEALRGHLAWYDGASLGHDVEDKLIADTRAALKRMEE